jgi:hypothetical protein
LATRIDARLKDAVVEVCEARGMKIQHFIQEALIDKLEELEDSESVAALRREPTRPLDQVLAEIEAE